MEHHLLVVLSSYDTLLLAQMQPYYENPVKYTNELNGKIYYVNIIITRTGFIMFIVPLQPFTRSEYSLVISSIKH